MLVEYKSAFRQAFGSLSYLLVILLVLVSVDSARAADQNQLLNSYLKTHFADDEGLPANIVEEMLQSREGFLWLRLNAADLARFDGRHFEKFEGLGLVWTMALAPNGDLWLGTSEDLKQIPASALNQFGRLPAISYHPGPGVSSQITALFFTRNGVMWVGTGGGLYRFEHGAFSFVLPGAPVDRMEETEDGHLWIMTTKGPVEWDGANFVRHPEVEERLGVKPAEIVHVFEDSHGVTWFCTKQGVARRSAGKIEKLAPWGPKASAALRIYEDAKGNVWIIRANGVFRAAAGGLQLEAGMNARYIYNDRDGNLWVGTNGDGLYRFKDRAVRMFTTADGLPNNVAMTVLATHDAAVWIGFNCGGLARFDGSRFQTYNEKNGLLNGCVWDLAEDPAHDLWVGTWGGGIFRLHDGKFTQYSKSQGLSSAIVRGMIAARDGSIWDVGSQAVNRIRDGQIRTYSRAGGVPPQPFRVFEDHEGRIWAGGFKGASRLIDDRFVRYSPLPEVESHPLGLDRSGHLYFRVEHQGIFRIVNDQPIPVAPELDAMEMIETEQGDQWLIGDAIFRVRKGGLDHPRPKDEPLDFEPFGLADGLATKQAGAGYPASALSRDGKLWITTSQGVAMLDLARLPGTDRKPEIYIEGVMVGRNQQPPGHDLTLPPGTHHVELNFDAVEITAPEKIRLQYRLDGVDSEWLDAGAAGRAIYSNIPPGTHAFHVRACNRSGIWDRAGMIYNVTQQPYFYQTRWFPALTIAFGALLTAGLYQLRMRQVARNMSVRFEERLAERTRIARDLHDTLLQSFSALLLRFQTASNLIESRPAEARQRVESAIEQASGAITEGRDAVHQLRSGEAMTADLAEAITGFVADLARDQEGEQRPRLRVQVEGAPRDLVPTVRDEAFRIAAEALRNAVRYAEARHIEAEIRYDEQNLRLRIRDDGRGIAPDVLEQGRAPGHWGLRGMRERAKLMGGSLEVWSRPGSGTEIELTIPAASAWEKPASRWSILLRGRRS